LELLRMEAYQQGLNEVVGFDEMYDDDLEVVDEEEHPAVPEFSVQRPTNGSQRYSQFY
jgi:hypothetical protein